MQSRSQSLAGEGTSLIECKTYRLRGHSEGGPNVSMDQPRSQEEADEWVRNRDPVKLFSEQLLNEAIVEPADVDRIRQEARDEIEHALVLAEAAPVIPSFEHLQSLLFAD